MKGIKLSTDTAQPEVEGKHAVVGDGEVVPELVFEDDLHEMTHAKLVGYITKRNNLVGRANAAHGDRVTITDDLIENSDDPEIVAAREARDEAILLLDSLVRPKVDEVVANAGASVEAVEAEIKAIDDKLKPGKKFYKELYGDDAVKHLPAEVRAKGITIGKSGTGGRRIRGFKVEVTVGDRTEGFDNFAGAAKWLDVETPMLQDAFFQAAGNPKAIKDAPDEVNFSVTFTEQGENEGETTEASADVYAYRDVVVEDESAEDSE